MSRKRFIKLMMAQGWSRNAAAALADNVGRYGSYERLYKHFNRLYSALSVATTAMQSVIGMFSAACGSAAEALSNLSKQLEGVTYE